VTAMVFPILARCWLCYVDAATRPAYTKPPNPAQ
jgi:hypothetical protein